MVLTRSMLLTPARNPWRVLTSVISFIFALANIVAMLAVEDVDALLQASLQAPVHVMVQRDRLLDTATACLAGLEAGVEDKAAACQLLLQTLRVLRNLCTAGPAACEELLRLGAVAAVAQLLALVERGAVQLDWQLPLVAAQLLANAATACAGCAAAVWAGAFPVQLNILAHIHSGK